MYECGVSSRGVAAADPRWPRDALQQERQKRDERLRSKTATSCKREQTTTRDRNGRGRALYFGSRADPPRSDPKATNGACGRSGATRRVNGRVGPSVRMYISIIYRYAHRRSSSRALRPNGTISAFLQRRVPLSTHRGTSGVLTGVLERYSH